MLTETKFTHLRNSHQQWCYTKGNFQHQSVSQQREDQNGKIDELQKNEHIEEVITTRFKKTHTKTQRKCMIRKWKEEILKQNKKKGFIAIYIYIYTHIYNKVEKDTHG